MNECMGENLDWLKCHICFFNAAQTQTNDLIEEVLSRLKSSQRSIIRLHQWFQSNLITAPY